MTPDRRSRARRVIGVLALLVLAAALLATPVVPGRSGADLRPTAAVDASGMAPITIGTVPAVPGFPVVLDGVTSLTDAQGSAHFIAPPPSEPDLLADRITLEEAELSYGGQQVRVAADRLYPSTTAPMLALSLSYLVRFGFRDEGGKAVPATSIQGMKVKSVTGQLLHPTPGTGTWLQGSRVIPTREGLRIKKLEWSLQEVTFRGSNVINASQQRFVPADQQDVMVELLFFGMTLHVHDALFGFSDGWAVALTFPDLQTRRYPLDEHGRLRLGSLPRGNYTLTILGPGLRLKRPLAVSRDQDLDLSFHSWWDVLTVLGGGAALAAGLGLVGRARRRGAAPAAHRPAAAASKAFPATLATPAALAAPPPPVPTEHG
jgi:hypothetical protein